MTDKYVKICKKTAKYVYKSLKAKLLFLIQTQNERKDLHIV